jgi:AraC-like DNA-binding protein
MIDGLVFGWRSALLLALLAPLIPLIVALATTLINRTANLTLAALLAVLVGIVVPWMIGFAGFYDKWIVLSYVPFALSLGVLPLLWLYVIALTSGGWPRHGWWHLIPAALQALYKVGQAATGPLAPVTLIIDLALIGQFAAYSWLSFRALSNYRRVLATQRSDDELFASHWLSRAIGAVTFLLVLDLAHKAWGLFDPLGYEGLMGLHVAIASTTLYLGVEGWRMAKQAMPIPAEVVDIPTQSAGKDWHQFGLEIASRTRDAGWACDSSLTLPKLARHLGSNTNYVSRALNEGLGMGFSEFVNRERSENVAAMLRDRREDNLLDLALEAGFSSKATFNRSFDQRFGVSPSAYRKGLKS